MSKRDKFTRAHMPDAWPKIQGEVPHFLAYLKAQWKETYFGSQRIPMPGIAEFRKNKIYAPVFERCRREHQAWWGKNRPDFCACRGCRRLNPKALATRKKKLSDLAEIFMRKYGLTGDRLRYVIRDCAHRRLTPEDYAKKFLPDLLTLFSELTNDEIRRRTVQFLVA